MLGDGRDESRDDCWGERKWYIPRKAVGDGLDNLDWGDKKNKGAGRCHDGLHVVR